MHYKIAFKDLAKNLALNLPKEQETNSAMFILLAKFLVQHLNITTLSAAIFTAQKMLVTLNLIKALHTAYSLSEERTVKLDHYLPK